MIDQDVGTKQSTRWTGDVFNQDHKILSSDTKCIRIVCFGDSAVPSWSDSSAFEITGCC